MYVQAFSPSGTIHGVRPRWVWVSTNTGGGDWQIQADSFLAWETAQNFTIPFYQLNSIPNADDVIYLPSTNGTPPSVDGFQAVGIVGYVYGTQVCGSVPLLCASHPTTTDHWYTTSASEQNSLLVVGWTDAGFAGFVLPLTNSRFPSFESGTKLNLACYRLSLYPVIQYSTC